MRSLVRMIRSTHTHPVNQALHCTGAPFYAVGLANTVGHFAGVDTNLALGIAMWTAAVGMFVVGHKIEGNIGSMTPVLICRLVSRKVARYYSVTQRVHFLRT
jgi:hypothetical protein